MPRDSSLLAAGERHRSRLFTHLSQLDWLRPGDAVTPADRLVLPGLEGLLLLLV